MKEFTVLGLVGPAGSGKDLVADWFIKEKNFVKVAFADPMKRFVTRAFPGMHAERLWGPSELRNEEIEINSFWWYEAIGHFGDGAKEIVNEVLDPGIRVDAYLKLHDWFTWLHKAYPEKISARVILQTLGTEWGRTVDPLMWTKYAHKIAAKIREGAAYTQFNGIELIGLPPEDRFPGVVIPDHRFANEVATTQKLGGYVLRLRRIAHESGVDNVGIQGHASETELRSIPGDAFDFILELEEGIDKVHWALESICGNATGPAWEVKRWVNSRS